MAEIIDLHEKKTQEQRRRATQERTTKMSLILQMFQCSHCTMKCMKCGIHLDASSPPKRSPSIPYRFCDCCMEEYQEFLKRLHGKGDPEEYWYNQEWTELWKAWINYHETLRRYELSEGFRRLLKEFKGSEPPSEE